MEDTKYTLSVKTKAGSKQYYRFPKKRLAYDAICAMTGNQLYRVHIDFHDLSNATHNIKKQKYSLKKRLPRHVKEEVRISYFVQEELPGARANFYRKSEHRFVSIQYDISCLEGFTEKPLFKHVEESCKKLRDRFKCLSIEVLYKARSAEDANDFCYIRRRYKNKTAEEIDRDIYDEIGNRGLYLIDDSFVLVIKYSN